MKLKDKRLLACAKMVSGDYVCDIGTDHGYLPAYLILTGKCARAVAADINQMPLSAARTTFENYNIADKADFVLADGLCGVNLDNVTDIVIAGMGGELISRIISADERVKSGVNLILQPMTRASVLRKFLAQNGFEIISESGVIDGRFVYTVIKCRYNGICREISAAEENIGQLDAKNPEDKAYILRQLERLENAALGMEKNAPEKALLIRNAANQIKEETGL